METNTILVGDALSELKKLPDESIDCVMTSPPYWGLRDYGTATWEGGDEECDHFANARYSGSSGLNHAKVYGEKDQNKGTPYKDKCGKCGAIRQDQQLGLEPDFRDFVENLCLIFDEIKRVLKPTGTCWVNLGDTYNGGGRGGNSEEKRSENWQPKYSSLGDKELPSKTLCQIPSRFAIAMTDRGWILRNEIIWYKKNVMPQSVKDRFTVDFEKIFFFTKSPRYYFEQQFEPLSEGSAERYEYDFSGNVEGDGKLTVREPAGQLKTPTGRNKRAVWQINPKPFSEAHFAVYPEKLCETPIKAGCPEKVCKKCGQPQTKQYQFGELKGQRTNPGKPSHLTPQGYLRKGKSRAGVAEVTGSTVSSCGCDAGFEPGVVLDPFLGSGTTALVAEKLGRRWVGIELSEEYAEIARRRTSQQGLL